MPLSKPQPNVGPSFARAGKDEVLIPLGTPYAKLDEIFAKLPTAPTAAHSSSAEPGAAGLTRGLKPL